MSKPVVVCRVRGGIGNQLFSYAAARRLAVVNDMELVIDNITGFQRDFTYQRTYELEKFKIPCRFASYSERLEPFSRLRRHLLSTWEKRREFSERRYIFEEKLDFDRRLLDLKPTSSVFMDGYWQSANYFRDVESVIRADLEIIPPTDTHNLRMSEQITSSHSSVACHVRFFDDPLQGGSNNAQVEYYVKAIEIIETRVENPHYFLFSDHPDAAAEIISLPPARYTCVSHNTSAEMAYADLWLMSLCSNFIIANSTFSWWGAWLSAAPNKLVIAPGFEKRDGVSAWGFEGLIPDEWITI
ncbi:MAG: alpha-1,2-fucosyltransferase [Pseudomonadales bacterium]|nr:alpha-1,2-fucosyltransferase [Pseudomonadales bacterium]